METYPSARATRVRPLSPVRPLPSPLRSASLRLRAVSAQLLCAAQNVGTTHAPGEKKKKESPARRLYKRGSGLFLVSAAGSVAGGRSCGRFRAARGSACARVCVCVGLRVRAEDAGPAIMSRYGRYGGGERLGGTP